MTGESDRRSALPQSREARTYKQKTTIKVAVMGKLVDEFQKRPRPRLRALLGISCVFASAIVLAACGASDSPQPSPAHTPVATATPGPVLTPTPRLAVEAIFPEIGSPSGGDSIVVEGKGFALGNTAIRLGDAFAPDCLTLSDSRVSCTTPRGIAGSLVSVTASQVGQPQAILADAFRYAGGGSGRVLRVEPAAEPSIVFDDAIGTTTVVVDYVVRNNLNIPLEESDTRIRFLLDGVDLSEDPRFDEAVLDREAEELELNLFLLLVLDASFSLQTFDVPQFPLLQRSAENVVLSASGVFNDRVGDFNWSVVWFDELIAKPDPNFVDSFRFENVPLPEPGSFSKLFGAIDAGLESSETFRVSGVAAEERDRHVIVIFTDGRDNISDFHNPETRETGELRNGDPFPRFGWQATNLSDVLFSISDHPSFPTNLDVHTIALGEPCTTSSQERCFDAAALRQIAQVGFGRALESIDDVSALFDEIRKEFTTFQSSGVRLALPPGDYDLDLVVERADGSSDGSLQFSFSTGRDNVGFTGYR